jgi:hypothetical protein
MSLEKKILKHLLSDDSFTRKTIPFIKGEYFHDAIEKTVFEQIDDYVTKYNSLPTKDSLLIEVDKKDTLNTDQHKKTIAYINEIYNEEFVKGDTEWLIETTEKFCQEKAVYNAIMQSIGILDEGLTR